MRRPSAISGYSCFCLWHPLAFLSPHSSSLSCSQPPSSTMFMMQEGTFASGPRSSNFSVQGNGLMLWRPGKATQDSAQEKTGRRFLCYDSLPPWAQACYGASNSNQSASHAIYIHGISIPPELSSFGCCFLNGPEFRAQGQEWHTKQLPLRKQGFWV